MNRFRFVLIPAIALLVTCSPAVGVAQLDQTNFLSATSTQLTTSNYYFAKPNEITIVVNVLGFVQKPGRYEISKNVDLVNLLALAGGATPEGTLGEVMIRRILEVEGKIRMKEVYLDLNEIAKVNRADLILSPGDVIQVGRSSWAGFKDIFSVMVGSAVIITAVAYVVWATSLTK